MSEIRPRVLIFAQHYLPGYKGGGPIKTLKNLVESTGKTIDYRIVTGDRDLGDDTAYSSVDHGQWNAVGRADVLYVAPGLRGLLTPLNVIRRSDCDLVYLNSLFSIRFSLIPLVMSRCMGLTVVLAPRGELSQGALALKQRKKSVFLTVFRWLGLHRYLLFHGSTRHEKADIEAVFGEGVDTRIAENIGSHEFGEVQRRVDSEPLKAVFLSRISPKKNLLGAIHALAHVNAPTVLDVYGPLEDAAYWEQCRAAIATLPTHVRVDYKGHLTPPEIIPTLSHYDVFFFPTKGENYGHVIAEALCAGLPLLISDQTPWRDLETAGIGWTFSDDDGQSYAAMLDRLAEMPAEKFLEMRENVRAWATSKFSETEAVDANISLFFYAFRKK